MAALLRKFKVKKEMEYYSISSTGNLTFLAFLEKIKIKVLMKVMVRSF